MKRAPEDSGGVGMKNEPKLEGLYRLEKCARRAPCPCTPRIGSHMMTWHFLNGAICQAYGGVSVRVVHAVCACRKI